MHPPNTGVVVLLHYVVASMNTVASVGVSASAGASTLSHKYPGTAKEVSVLAGAVSATMAEPVHPPPPDTFNLEIFNGIGGEEGNSILAQKPGVEEV